MMSCPEPNAAKERPVPGEIWYCDFGYAIKHRPVVILPPNKHSSEAGKTLVMLITSQERDDLGRRFSLRAGEGGLTTKSWVKLEEVNEVGLELFDRKIGQLQKKKLDEIVEAAGSLTYPAKRETLERLGWG
jgi:mRNA-degrading endonuclease toxin of MazEF toxin-antitoxin module